MCYLRDLGDANRLVNLIQSCPGGNAVVIGGGYIGMECAASLVINRMSVTMVFPEDHCSMYCYYDIVSSLFNKPVSAPFFCVYVCVGRREGVCACVCVSDRRELS